MSEPGGGTGAGSPAVPEIIDELARLRNEADRLTKVSHELLEIFVETMEDRRRIERRLAEPSCTGQARRDSSSDWGAGGAYHSGTSM